MNWVLWSPDAKQSIIWREVKRLWSTPIIIRRSESVTESMSEGAVLNLCKWVADWDFPDSSDVRSPITTRDLQHMHCNYNAHSTINHQIQNTLQAASALDWTERIFGAPVFGCKTIAFNEIEIESSENPSSHITHFHWWIRHAIHQTPSTDTCECNSGSVTVKCP